MLARVYTVSISVQGNILGNTFWMIFSEILQCTNSNLFEYSNWDSFCLDVLKTFQKADVFHIRQSCPNQLYYIKGSSSIKTWRT